MTEHMERSWGAEIDVDLLLSSLAGGNSRSGEFTGMKALMLAILEDGIRSYLSPDVRLRSEAEYWVNGPQQNFPFAFKVICEILGLESTAVSAALVRLRAQNVSPRRAIRRSRPNVRRAGRLKTRRSA